MRKVTCHECNKRYDFDDDGFCPRCGAFNAPASVSRIAVDGSVVRVDGLNERNHHNSFLHEELHGEERERRRLKLDWDSDSLEKVVRLAEKGKSAVVLPKNVGKKKGVSGFVWAILAFVICINFLLPLIATLFLRW